MAREAGGSKKRTGITSALGKTLAPSRDVNKVGGIFNL